LVSGFCGCASNRSRERRSVVSSPSGQPTPVGPGSVLADRFSSLVADGRSELREGYAEVGDVRLHYVEAGDGPLIVLLHGFPG
jgi:hypothetical protein